MKLSNKNKEYDIIQWFKLYILPSNGRVLTCKDGLLDHGSKSHMPKGLRYTYNVHSTV